MSTRYRLRALEETAVRRRGLDSSTYHPFRVGGLVLFALEESWEEDLEDTSREATWKEVDHVEFWCAADASPWATLAQYIDWVDKYNLQWEPEDSVILEWVKAVNPEYDPTDLSRYPSIIEAANDLERFIYCARKLGDVIHALRSECAADAIDFIREQAAKEPNK